jgi:hypothetical protein
MSWRIGRHATTLVGSTCVGLLCAYYVQHSSQWDRAQRRFQHRQRIIDATRTESDGTMSNSESITALPSCDATTLTSSPPSKNMATSASTLTGNVVDAVLRDGNTVENVVVLLKGVFTHHDFLFHLKAHFKEQFTTNDDTVASLRQFVVDGILKDPFVSDQLIGVGKDLGTHLAEHPRVYPGPTLELLKDAALDALRTERFQKELTEALKEGGKHAVFFGGGPPVPQAPKSK